MLLIVNIGHLGLESTLQYPSKVTVEKRAAKPNSWDALDTI